MSDLDDLELIAEANAFGFRSIHHTGLPAIKKPFLETCSRGHARTPENTLIRKKRPRLVCRICRRMNDRARRAAIRQASGPDAARIPGGE